jgi:hypothetical protein
LPCTTIRRILGTAAFAALVVAAVPTVATAAPSESGGNYVCTGTSAAPGTLAGNFDNVAIAGSCVVDAGNVNIAGNLTVAPGASLAAIFGENDLTHSGTSDIKVGGNMVVEKGASVMLGCYSLQVTLWLTVNGLGTVPDFPCVDDPNQANPTLSTNDIINGNLVSYDPLGTVIHNTVVRGNVTQFGGGAGLGCAAVGIFSQYFGLPEYSDYADVTVGGNMVLTGLDTCWYAAIRNTVRGNLTDTSNVSTPDANEAVTNTVYGNLVCRGNNPAVQLGDSDGPPNQVGGNATGECGFDVLLLNPPPEAGVNVTPVLQHISVPLHH